MMTKAPDGAAAQGYARTAGFLYLAIMLSALFAEAFVRGQLVVPGDAGASGTNIAKSMALFRAGVVADLFDCLCDVVLATFIYVLFRPFSRGGAMLAALLRFAAAVVLGIVGVLQLGSALLLGGGGYLKSVDGQQLATMAYLMMKMHGLGYSISLAFFGAGFVVLGVLIARSALLPRLLGGMLGFAGLCYLVHGFAAIGMPSLSAKMYPWTLLPGFVSEWVLCGWLIIKGVNVEKWRSLQAAQMI